MGTHGTALFCPSIALFWHRLGQRVSVAPFLPLSACTPNSQRLCSQKAPLPTPNRRRNNNCNLCALSCGADQYMPMYRLCILQCATSTATLAASGQLSNRTHTLVVSASRCVQAKHLRPPNSARRNEHVRMAGTLCLYKDASAALSSMQHDGTQPPNCGVTSTTVNMRPLKGTESVLPVGLRKVSGG